ncbi:DegT/DnrJ/EryC1/StrS family aminotransferase [Parapedobacter tibetensis]|uniref:DegT/DnrJ/EryC1/StrS family aminotransferase n=1 Tax=Parapedobacter tibetensis TaxID=2972951 RepID=UPI00214D8364|nr:DegT/DnrJ/EryC1/StrS family aminotransferase [Parapedobacter tibetensis]
MKHDGLNRRNFIGKVGYGTLAALAATSIPSYGSIFSKDTDKLAIFGGKPVRGNKPWPRWPYVDEKIVEKVTETTRSGIWCRIQSATGTVPTFEQEYAKLLGTSYCVATGSGTQALSTCVEALGIGPGDEVITSPYTDMGTVSAILTSRALPVLADLDPDSYQLDPDDVERRITPNTKAIMPVHIMGQPCEMDRIMAIAKKHNLRVIEDSCQAQQSIYRGQKLGTIGDLGCFSFQSSKTMPCGEGGAIVGNDYDLMEQCFTVQNHGTSRQGRHVTIGPKYRMNEFEGAVLLGQLDGIVDRYNKRNENARYLTEKLKDFPGLRPQKLYEGTESGSYYLYALSYKEAHFNGATRAQFLKALSAEGIGLSPYISNGLHREPWIDHIVGLDSYKKMYGEQRLEAFKAGMDLPNCDRVCNEMAMLWASGPLLAEREDMDHIVDAIMKVYEHRDQLKSI